MFVRRGLLRCSRLVLIVEGMNETVMSSNSSLKTLVAVDNPFSTSLCGNFFAGDHAFF